MHLISTRCTGESYTALHGPAKSGCLLRCALCSYVGVLSFYIGIFTQFLSGGLMLILLLSVRATGSRKPSPAL